jgi:hypothetical protein
MKSILLLALFALFAVANAGQTFTATVSDGLTFAADVNVTVDAGDDRYHYRKTTLIALPIVNTIIYESIASDVQYSGSHADGTLDVIFGYGNFIIGTFPGYILAYISAQGHADSDHLSATFTASGAAIANVYYALEEVSSSGSVVSTHELNDVIFSMDSADIDHDDEIHYATYKGDVGGGSIAFTMVVSAVAGILNVGGAPITPKSAEVIVEINGYDYASTSNHLRLVLYSATASAVAEVQASANTVVSGSGNTQVYLHFNGEAVVDGASKSVTVNGVADANTGSSDNLGSLEAFVTANGELTVDIRKVTIDFPKNAGSISYDPSMGFQAPKDLAAAGTLSVPAALIFALAALLAFFL